MSADTIINLPVVRIADDEELKITDSLAIEEPLEIRLEHGPTSNRKIQNISVTMRTPGNDAELALGFLFTEGIITQLGDITQIEHCFITCAENKENVIQVSLHEDTVPDLRNTERNFYTTSSCGVCGKGSINAIRTVSEQTVTENNINSINAQTLISLPQILENSQQIFADTGGLHASALFTND